MDQRTFHLLASFAHELRTPLGAIAGFAELLRLGVHGPLTDAQRDDLTRITANQAVLVSVITDFMAYAEAATASPPPVLVEQALLPLLHGAVDRCRIDARDIPLEVVAADIAFGAHGGPGRTGGGSAADGMRVAVETTAFEDILETLVRDAVAHAGSPGSIVIRVSARGADAIVDVESGGPPFTTSTAEAIVAPFGQHPDGSRATSARGSLALPRARLLARRLGGDIMALAGPVRTVRFAMPAASDAGSADRVDAA